MIGHHPPRSNGHHGNTEELLDSLEPIMQVRCGASLGSGRAWRTRASTGCSRLYNDQGKDHVECYGCCCASVLSCS